MKAFFTGLVLFMAVGLMAEPDWSHSYEEVKLQASKENKQIMVMLSKEGCDACWYMEHIVFDDANVKQLVMDNFIPVYLDVENDEVPSEFHYIGTPTFYFMRPTGEKIVPRINGASNVKDFTDKLTSILQKVSKP